MEKYCAALSSFQIFKMSQGDAKPKVFVKCTCLRVGRITPLARERSHVILGTHMSVATCQNVAKNSRPVVTKVPETSMLPKEHTQRNKKKGIHKTKDEVNLKSLQHLVLVLKRTELHVRLSILYRSTTAA